MIGVLVKGGKLPKSCWKCEYGNTDGVSHVCPFYCENHVKQSDWSEERHPQCPLEQMVIEPLKEHQWILTSERLPECQWGAEVGGILFCLKETGHVEIGVYGTGGKLRDRYFRRWTDGFEGWDANSVLAWMFAPKPPKG